MGFNTTVVVLNDALHYIKEDPEFGKNLSDAVLSMQLPREHQRADVPAGNHGNAATVIEKHHADSLHAVLVGGNYGQDMGYASGYSAKWPDNARDILQNLGRTQGLHIAPKKYEDIVKAILRKPEVLPLLLGISKDLDKMIEKKLKG